MIKASLLIWAAASQVILLSQWYKSECDVYNNTARPDVMYYFLEALNTSYPAGYAYYSSMSPLNTCGFGRKGSENVIPDSQCCHVGRHPLISIRSVSYGRVNYSDPSSIAAQIPRSANGVPYCNLRAIAARSIFNWLEISIAPGVCSDYMRCSDAGDKLEVYGYRNCTLLRGTLPVAQRPIVANIGLGNLFLQSANITGASAEFKFTDHVPNQPYFNPEVNTPTEWFSVIYIGLSQLILLYGAVRFGIRFWYKRTAYLGTCFFALLMLLANGGFVWKYLFTLVPQSSQDLDNFYIFTGTQSVLIAFPTLIIAMQSVNGM
jgi:hypothetical protein